MQPHRLGYGIPKLPKRIKGSIIFFQFETSRLASSWPSSSYNFYTNATTITTTATNTTTTTTAAAAATTTNAVTTFSNESKSDSKIGSGSGDGLSRGLVIQRCGEHLLVQLPRANATEVKTAKFKNFENMILCSQASSFKNFKSSYIVAGDLVDVDVSAKAVSRDSDGVVHNLVARRNVLQRPGQKGTEHNLKMKVSAFF
jgi:hypothetical protein